jgi:hypothetical protein
LKYSLSYRDIVEMGERGLKISHTTIMRWVHEFGAEIDKRIRPFLKPIYLGGLTKVRYEALHVEVSLKCLATSNQTGYRMACVRYEHIWGVKPI